MSRARVPMSADTKLLSQSLRLILTQFESILSLQGWPACCAMLRQGTCIWRRADASTGPQPTFAHMLWCGWWRRCIAKQSSEAKDALPEGLLILLVWIIGVHANKLL